MNISIAIAENVLLTNEDIENDNFVELIVEGKSEIVHIDDLFVAVEAFRHCRELSDKRDRELEKKEVEAM